LAYHIKLYHALIRVDMSLTTKQTTAKLKFNTVSVKLKSNINPFQWTHYLICTYNIHVYMKLTIILELL